jgi:hypothetical protein
MWAGDIITVEKNLHDPRHRMAVVDISISASTSTGSYWMDEASWWKNSVFRFRCGYLFLVVRHASPQRQGSKKSVLLIFLYMYTHPEF